MSAKDLVVYVDFDSTLYNTPRFAKDLEAMIVTAAGVHGPKVAADKKAFMADVNLGGYDFEAHIRSYDLDPADMWQQLENLATAHDYLYADSARFIARLHQAGYRPHILTFGVERFQTAKITPTLPRLTDGIDYELGVDVVMRRKREHIIDYHAGMRGVLVDDKPDQDLPSGFTEITIDRDSQAAAAQQNDTIYLVSNLGQAADIITAL